VKPATDLVLTVFAADIAKRAAALPPGPERMMLFTFQAVFEVVARHADDAAAMRLDEIAELAGLLREAGPICSPELAASLHKAADEADHASRDIRVSALEAVLDTLKAALIELQAWLETSTHAQAPALLTQSWDFLARANAKRLFSLKPW
jgi:hypothetical protein